MSRGEAPNRNDVLLSSTMMEVGVSKNGFYPPNHPYFNRDFHGFNHPFWGTPIFGNTQVEN